MKTILVVDDEKSIRSMLGYTFEDAGYKTILCENGEHAIPHISSADVLITDFNMSGMDGVELTRRAKREKPNMPVIILTGAPKDIPADHLANKVVEKPFNIEQLQEVIADLLKEEHVK